MRALLAAIILALLPTPTVAQTKSDLSFTPPRASGVYGFTADGYVVEVSTDSQLWISIDGLTMTVEQMPIREVGETGRLILLEAKRLERINTSHRPAIKATLRAVQRDSAWGDDRRANTVMTYVRKLQRSRIASSLFEGVRVLEDFKHRITAIEEARNNLANILELFREQIHNLVFVTSRVETIEPNRENRLPNRKKRSII